MYGHISSAISEIVRLHESRTSARAIEAAVEEEFSHFELCTINEHIKKLTNTEVANYVTPSLRPASLSAMLEEFFDAVHNAL